MASAQDYETQLQSARHAFGVGSGFAKLLAPGCSARRLEAFAIEYCARGPHLTCDVSTWIRRAGEGCARMGLQALGRQLGAHAAEEEGHDGYFVRDTHHLVAYWNRHHHPKLSATQLLARPMNAAALAYVELHESVISGPTPFAQLAIEYEIEALSVRELPRLLHVLADRLGQDYLARLSFLTEHARLDEGHTQHNRRLLSRLLQDRPSALGPLVAAGRAALSCYTRIFDDAFATTTPLVEQALCQPSSGRGQICSGREAALFA